VTDASKLRLPAIRTLATRTALPGLRLNRNRLVGRRPRRPNPPGQLEHPRPQLGVVLNAVPRAVAADDEAVRRFHLELSHVASQVQASNVFPGASVDQPKSW
jgi:hypothetical protein